MFISLWKSLSLPNCSCNTALSVFITYAATSSTYFCVLVYVVRSLDPSTYYFSSRTILLPSSNSNGNPFVDSSLLGGTCNSASLNSSKAGCVATLFICNSIACRPSYVCCCYYCKCCRLVMVSIQLSYTFTSKCRCFSPFGNPMSCSLLISWLYSLGCFSYGDVICSTSCFYYLNYVSHGVVIYGIFEVYLIACTIVGIIDGSTLPLIIFCAFISMLSCSLFTLEPKAFPSSTLFFLRTFLGKFVGAFFSIF